MTHDQSTPRPTNVSIGRDRLYALDLARFAAMLFMMQGHVLDALVRTSELDITKFPWDWWFVIRGITAPVFLMVSGAVHAFANKRGDDGRILEHVLEKRIRWAITIIGIGYLMVFPANRVWDLPFVPKEGWRVFHAVNILQLTGITMLLFVVLVQRTRSVRSMGRVGLVTALIIIGLSPVVASTDWTGIVPGIVEGYLTVRQGTLFPIFVFSAYLFVGLYVGSLLYGMTSEHRMAVLRYRIWIYGLVIAVAAYGLHAYLLAQGMSMAELESASSPLLAIRRIGIVLVIFGASAWIVTYTWRLREWYGLFGRKSLHIYVIHLVLLWGTPWFDGLARHYGRQLSLGTGLGVVAGIMITTLAIAYAFDRYERAHLSTQVRQRVRRVVLALMCYLLLV
ncbi:MAG: acyltransferase [Candidatus Kapabacteria bacterium]|nr:acyltransferase [Candidatus Kapabacteria bacterium]